MKQCFLSVKLSINLSAGCQQPQRLETGGCLQPLRLLTAGCYSTLPILNAVDLDISNTVISKYRLILKNNFRTQLLLFTFQLLLTQTTDISK